MVIHLLSIVMNIYANSCVYCYCVEFKCEFQLFGWQGRCDTVKQDLGGGLGRWVVVFYMNCMYIFNARFSN